MLDQIAECLAQTVQNNGISYFTITIPVPSVRVAGTTITLTPITGGMDM